MRRRRGCVVPPRLIFEELAPHCRSGGVRSLPRPASIRTHRQLTLSAELTWVRESNLGEGIAELTWVRESHEPG
jgi:hypothetical protein